MDFNLWTCIIIWCVVLAITLFIEISTADLTSVWFCAGSIIAMILAFCNVQFYIQLIVFIGSSLLFIVLARPLIKKMMNKGIIHTNADKIIDTIGLVIKTIPAGDIGEVKVRSELWRAISLDTNDILEGEKIIVKSISGNKLLVAKIEKNSNIEII